MQYTAIYQAIAHSLAVEPVAGQQGGLMGFSPKSLFASGAQGAWYDPSDYSTMFEDAAGTTPITSPLEKPVGLMLDKSKSLTLGSELVTNGDFSNGTTGWSPVNNATLSVVNGRLRVQGNGTTTYPAATTTISTAAAKTYLVSVSLISATPSSIIVGARQGSWGTTAGQVTLNIGATETTKQFYVNATGTSLVIGFEPSTGSALEDFYIDNISVREIPGNHATQSTTTSRPTLSARYNLLTKTEQFDDAAWTKESVSISPNAINDPNGVLSADKMISASGATYGVNQLYTFVSAQHTYTIYAKAAGYSYLQLLWTSNCSTDYANFNLNTGSVSAGTYVSASITDAGNGWYRCSITSNITAGAGRVFAWIAAASNSGRGITVTGDGTSGIYIWGADLRVANDGIGLPAYQRVNTASDYDYAGFPPYLKFDGTDDSMATNSIDFTGTDKMSVFAGVRKLSDATSYGIIAEPRGTLNLNNWTIMAPFDAGTPSFDFSSRGSLLASATATTGYAAPTTNVLTGLGNISGDSAILRVNGTQAASSTADQGTGNYGNYPLYIGRRAGTSLPFNGRIYSLIVCGKLASAAEIASTEAYINNKTKAY